MSLTLLVILSKTKILPELKKQLQKLIAQGKTKQAIQVLLRITQQLKDNDLHNEVIIQSGHFEASEKAKRHGVTSFEEKGISIANINQALLGIIDEVLAKEVLFESENHSLVNGPIIGVNDGTKILEKQNEFDHSNATVTSSKNLLIGEVNASGDINIGDKIENIFESRASKILKVSSYIIVPVIAVISGFLIYKNQILKESITLMISIENILPNPYLPFKQGEIKLFLDDKEFLQKIEKKQIAFFENIPATILGKTIRIKFNAIGFVPIDTLVFLDKKKIDLTIRNDDSFGKIYGIVKCKYNDIPLGNVLISVMGITTETKEDGTFYLSIPPELQKSRYRVVSSKIGFKKYSLLWNPRNGYLEIHLEKSKSLNK